MQQNLLLVILVICVGIILSKLQWTKVKFGWLQHISRYLIWSLPFEFFPRIDVAGAGFRVSQFLVLAGFWVIGVLVLKKDSNLNFHKICFASFLPLGFLVLSTPSWFLVQDFQRFLVHMFGTLLVFGAMILVLNFATNIWKRLKELTLILVGCSMFGLYQFVGDMLGIPSSLTGLREHYTKAIFGIPRVQGTAVEPLYFAGMLVIPIVVLLVCIAQKQSLIRYFTTPKYSKINLLFLVIVLVVFGMTLSKGSFAVVALLSPFLGISMYFLFQNVRNLVHKYFVAVGFVLTFLGLAAVLFLNPVETFGSVGRNFVETLAGTSPSAVERGLFVKEAIVALPSNIVQGIGMGQYSNYVGENLGNLNDDGKAIVNNVYVEVWLENGIFAFMVFLIMILTPVYQSLGQSIFNKSKKEAFMKLQSSNNKGISLEPILPQIDNKIRDYKPNPSVTEDIKSDFLAKYCLGIILSAYLLLWTLFSPIFIMPIFILLGMTYNLTNKA